MDGGNQSINQRLFDGIEGSWPNSLTLRGGLPNITGECTVDKSGQTWMNRMTLKPAVGTYCEWKTLDQTSYFCLNELYTCCLTCSFLTSAFCQISQSCCSNSHLLSVFSVKTMLKPPSA